MVKLLTIAGMPRFTRVSGSLVNLPAFVPAAAGRGYSLLMSIINSIFESGCLQGYLQDQSGLVGNAEGIVFVSSARQTADALLEAGRCGRSVTVQGARTGINGGAVPMGGLVVNLTRMNRFLSFAWDENTGIGRICVETGVTLEQLERALASKSIDTGGFDEQSLSAWEEYIGSSELLEFMPNPSEKTATLGGMFACAASGPRLGSGMFFEHVVGVEAVFADGTILNFNADTTLDGRCLQAALLEAVKAHGAPKKHPFEAGPVADGMVGLLCGSEGALAVITALTLRLTAARGHTHGVLIPFESIGQMGEFWRTFQPEAEALPDSPILNADCFDRSCALLVRRATLSQRSGDVLPGFDAEGEGPVLLLQLRTQQEESLFETLELVLSCLTEAGAADDRATVASDSSQLSAMTGIQHRIVEASYFLSANQQCLAADICVPTDGFERIFSRISSEIAQESLFGILMGELLTGQISVRLLPQNVDEGSAAESAYARLLKYWTAEGCVCSGKYGVGRLKKQLLETLSKDQAQLERRLRLLTDPEGLLNPGVVADPAGEP